MCSSTKSRRSTRRDYVFKSPHVSAQVFVNFAKKQSDNLEQQEASPPGGGPSPLQRIIYLLKSRPANTELNALISEAPEELESDDDEGLISFEEERVGASFLGHLVKASVFPDLLLIYSAQCLLYIKQKWIIQYVFYM